MEVKTGTQHGESRFCVLLLLAAWIYFFAMDIVQFVRIRQLPPRGSDGANGGDAAGNEFSMFGDVAVKAIMEDHLTAYALWPLAVHFELLTGFSNLSGLVTPNLVSFLGAGVAVVAARLVSSPSSCVRRTGACVFIFRLWLDALDGIVYRRQHIAGAAANHQMSVRGSSGYFVDAVCDFFTGICLLLAFYVTLTRNSCLRPIHVLPWTHCERPSKAAAASGQPLPPHVSRKTIIVKLMVCAVVMAVSSASWDYFVSEYRATLEHTFADEAKQQLQQSLVRAPSTFLIFFAWKMFNAVELMNFAFYAVFLDKIWEYVNWMLYVGLFGWMCLVIITQVHVVYVESELAFAHTPVGQ